MNKRSSFHMGNEFNGYGDKTLLKANEHNTYLPLSQKNVYLTSDFSNLIPKMLGIISVAIDIKCLNNEDVSKLLGGMAIANQVILKKDKSPEGYTPCIQVSTLGLTTGSYPQNRISGSKVIINPGIQPGWEKQENGGWKYINESGSYIRGDWKQDKGKWYYLKADEYMATDWLKISGKWYYFKPGQENGFMVLGWEKIKDKWYYFKEEEEAGYMVLGWRKIEGKWYYFKEEEEAGYMALGWREIEGKLYYFKEEEEAGYMALGWREIEGKWYYFKEEEEAGYMVLGWREIEGKWYYFQDDGSMAVSKWIKDDKTGKKYWVDENGVWKDPDSGNIFKVGEGVSVNKKIFEKLEEYYHSNSAVTDKVDNDGTCVFAFEGLGSYAGGGNDFHPNGMYGAMMLVTKGDKITYTTKNSSTLPDWAKKNKATLKEGVYPYNTGTHKSTYTCLRHDAIPYIPCWYGNADGTFEEKDGQGINIHAAGNNRASLSKSPWSEGCQMVRWSDYVKFGKAVGFLEEGTKDIQGGTSAEINKLGTSHAKSINVIYVLDRSNLPKNQNGLFYPER